MNISKLFAPCLLAAVFASAQPPQTPVEEQPVQPPPMSSEALEAVPVSSSSEIAVSLLPPPASSSSSETVIIETKPASPEGKTVFDSLRGHAYNPYGTVGAASTVLDLITTPSDINEQKFIYISPTNRLGYAAFGIGSSTAMLGLDNSPWGSPAALILGYANSAFGIALNYSVAKTWQSDSNIDLLRRTSPGDNIGLYLSVPLGSATFYANANWLTTITDENSEGSYSLDYDDSETTFDDSQMIANLGLTDKLGSLTYDVFLNVIRSGITISNDDYKSVDINSYFGFALNFNIGYAALQNSTARVIVGANNYFYTAFYDKTKNVNGDNIMIFSTVPNILAEFSLFDNWLAFAGAGQALRLRAGDGDRDSKTSLLSIWHSNSSGAFAGIRYQRTNWALEAQISSNMFNNPFGGFSGDDMFAGLGGFVYF